MIYSKEQVDYAIETNPMKLKGLNVAIYGDSISDGSTGEITTETDYIGLLEAKYNWTIHRNAIGGTPLSTNSYATSAISKRIDELDTLVFDPDIVIVWGGHNDISYMSAPLLDFTDSTKNSISGAIRHISETVHLQKKDAKLYFLTMIPAVSLTPYFELSDESGVYVKDVQARIIEGQEMYQYGAIEIGKCGLNRTNMIAGDLSKDGVHIGEEGHAMVADYVSKYLINNY